MTDLETTLVIWWGCFIAMAALLFFLTKTGRRR